MGHRRLTFALMVVLLGLFALAGCSHTGDVPATTEPSNTASNASPGTSSTPSPENPEVILVTTTSVYDSGLLDTLLPLFEEQTGYKVKPIAIGTGAALAQADRGEADVILVHAPASEHPLVESGTLINRRLIAHNDFVVVGPSSDPAGIKDATSAADALKKISDSQALFLSRGDDSGTNKKELALWKSFNYDPSGQDWYQETGEGMGQTLTMASEKEGYTLTDRGTYLALKPNLSLDILYFGDPVLLNIYHVAQVNPDKFSNINADGAKAFVDFMLDPATQEVIGKFGVDKFGEQLFVPDGGKTEEDLTGGKTP